MFIDIETYFYIYKLIYNTRNMTLTAQ